MLKMTRAFKIADRTFITVSNDSFGKSPPSMPPDWYVDPWNPSFLRYWDGNRWTEHTKPIATSSTPPRPLQQIQTYREPVFVAPKRNRGPMFWIAILLSPVLLLVAAGVAYGVLSSTVVSEDAKKEANSILLTDRDFRGLQYSVELPDPPSPEQEAYLAKSESCYPDDPDAIYENEGNSFVFDDLSGMTIESDVEVYSSASSAASEIEITSDVAYFKCDEDAAGEYLGSGIAVEMDLFDQQKTTSGVDIRGVAVSAMSSSGSGVAIMTRAMQKGTIVAYVSVTFYGTEYELAQQIEQYYSIFEQAASIVEDRVSAIDAK